MPYSAVKGGSLQRVKRTTPKDSAGVKNIIIANPLSQDMATHTQDKEHPCHMTQEPMSHDKEPLSHVNGNLSYDKEPLEAALMTKYRNGYTAGERTFIIETLKAKIKLC